MDIFSHGAVGASIGALYGAPITGLLVAIVPDLVLGLKRVRLPTKAYDIAHSLGFTAITALLSHSSLVFYVLLSHIFLDVFTHGKTWAPPLLYPLTTHRFSMGTEWEWFSQSWFIGLLLILAWGIVWFQIL